MPTTTIYVQEATSEEPIQNLQILLAQMDGIERAIVDIDDGEFKIEYEAEKLSPYDIITFIEQQGMTVNRSE